MCPLCKSKNYSMTHMFGYSKDIVNECNVCKTVWVMKDEKADIIYINPSK